MSRPKKVILLVDPNPRELSILAFVLDVRGTYRVHKAETAEEALAFLDRKRPDLLITDIMLQPGVDGNELVNRAGYRGIKSVMTSRIIPRHFASNADLFWPRGKGSMAEFLAEVKCLSTKKRGPRPAQINFFPLARAA